jgi:hypothetical protein
LLPVIILEFGGLGSAVVIFIDDLISFSLTEDDVPGRDDDEQD